MNALASEKIAILGVINPASQGAGSVSTGWVKAFEFSQLIALIQAGALGTSATLDAKLEQASDSSGTGVKDVTGKSITQLTQAGTDSNKQTVINLRPNELDVNNGFEYVRLTLTVATAASLVSGLLCGVEPRNGTVSALDTTTVDEIVS